MGRIPDFADAAARSHARLGSDGAARLLDAGRAWNLAPVLESGGGLVFPHVGIETCGHHTAAVVHACLDSGADTVLLLGVLHALTDELEEARVRVAEGGDMVEEPLWGIQGPGAGRRTDWKQEFSLSHFRFLWQEETRRRGVTGPRVVERYPYLAGGRPELLPGMAELKEIAPDAAIVATADPFHHGIGYGDSVDTALAPEEGGLDLARRRIEEGLAVLDRGDHWGYNRHCVDGRSDARDVGQVLRYLIGPCEGRILDLVWEDMAEAYGKPAPTWVAGALLEFVPADGEATVERP
jgi:hypothetical protein